MLPNNCISRLNVLLYGCTIILCAKKWRLIQKVKNFLIISVVGGFLEKFEYSDVKILQSMGYKVHYAANINDNCYECNVEEMQKNGICVHHIDIARSPYMISHNAKAFKQLVEIVEQNDIKAIHCHEPVGAVLGRIVGLYFIKRIIPVMYTAHGFHFYKGAPLINNTLYYLAEKILARFTDYLILINHEDYNNAKKLGIRNKKNIFLIPGVGLDSKHFSAFDNEKKKKQRKKLGLDPEDLFIVSVGELNENKNHSIVLRTLFTMREQGEDISHIKYVICGDGFFRDKLPKWIKMLKLEENVKLYGYCKDVRPILGCADIFAFPSIREGLGQAGLEALAMGIPVLATENRGTREYIEDGVNGYFCDAKNVQSWTTGIKKIQSMSEDEYNTMKKNCRESVKQFELKNTEAIMKDVYERLDKEIG